MKQRVVVGLSGGVDSSVAALLLKEQGYDVIGLFMINWHDTTGTLYGDCSWKDDLVFAELVARKIGIPCYTVDLSEPYRQRVVDYMFAEYEKGRTPNPDILCNREIKFDQFVSVARQYEADYIATGHYSRIETLKKKSKTIYRLLAGVDPNKDQSYFLCQLSQKQLASALFPIGHLNKPQVRKIAEKNGLATAKRKDSQGICFVGKVDLPEFLKQKIKPREGEIIEIPENTSIFTLAPELSDNRESLDVLSQPWSYSPEDGYATGKHEGANYFTIGQRKGLDIGGKERPLFVIATDIEKNIVYVGQGEDHPGLYRNCLFIKNADIHWLRPDLGMQPGEKQNFLVRIRYRQPLQNATLHRFDNGMYILFENKQRGITPGQYAAWYLNDELIGSGVIDK
jgi:tRNA-specific 2-thiouridylase